MFTMSIYCPDIVEFITAKSEEGKIANANISVVVDDAFMKKVENDETYWTEFDGIKYQEYKARDIFNLIVEGAWRNGEPGILYYDKLNDSPYKYSGQEIMATNPCVVGDTLVSTENGEVRIKDLVGKDINVYCLDFLGYRVLAPATNICLTRKNSPIMHVYSTNKHLICTPDHLILTRDRGYVRADCLEIYDVILANIDGEICYEDIWKLDTVTDEVADVYDLTVPLYHNFIASGIVVHNCAEQGLPPNGCCNLGSFDVSKFIIDGKVNYDLLTYGVKLAVKFLNNVIDTNKYPNEEIENWSLSNRPIGIGIMGFADLLLRLKIAYGSEESIQLLKEILTYIYVVARQESENLSNEYVVPENCKVLPEPRYNITLTTVAPTGTVSLIAGCSSGIEPIFSEITVRNDKTGIYLFENDLSSQPYFRCAVAANGATEVTWEEHIGILSAAQMCVDSGVSKTINFPTNTHRETIAKAFIMAWKMGCKGLAVYRNGSRKVEVLSPKNLKKDKCPKCDGELIALDGIKKCTNPSCGFVLEKEE